MPLYAEEVAQIGAGTDTTDVEQLDGTFQTVITVRELNRDDVVAYRV